MKKMLTTLAAVALLAACDGAKNTYSYSNESASDEPQKFIEKDYPGFKGEMYRLVENYLLLKDALVESDAITARAMADGMRRELVDTQVDSLEEDERAAWLATKEKLDNLVSDIGSTDDLSVQRQKFSELSALLATSVKTYQLPEGETVYWQFCPMAFNNEGGYWLSAQEEIENPYFGEKMMTCGRVDQTLSF